jgi:hypothetical protein
MLLKLQMALLQPWNRCTLCACSSPNYEIVVSALHKSRPFISDSCTQQTPLGFHRRRSIKHAFVNIWSPLFNIKLTVQILLRPHRKLHKLEMIRIWIGGIRTFSCLDKDSLIKRYSDLFYYWKWSLELLLFGAQDRIELFYALNCLFLR